MKLLSVEKVGDNYWVFESPPSDPENTTQTIYSLLAFSDDMYEHFFDVNNTAVGKAHEHGFGFKGTYDSFYELGMRVSQQLSGQVREWTIPKYQEKEDQIKTITLDSIREGMLRGKKTDLDQIITGEVFNEIPENDKERVQEIVEKIRQDNPQIDIESIKKDYHSFSSVVEVYVDRLQHSFWPIAEVYRQVPAEARAEFLALVKSPSLNGAENRQHNSFFDYPEQYQDLLQYAEELDGETASSYFKVLRLEMERGEKNFTQEIEFFTDRFHQEIDREHKPFFIELALKAQEENLPQWRESIPYGVAPLLAKYSITEARQIANQAFEMIKQSQSPWEFLESKSNNT